jgi:hypothetical protein
MSASRPVSCSASIHLRASATDHCAIQAIEWPSKVTPREIGFRRVPPQSGHGSSTTPSTSVSSEGKLCSRPLSSPPRTESS